MTDISSKKECFEKAPNVRVNSPSRVGFYREYLGAVSSEFIPRAINDLWRGEFTGNRATLNSLLTRRYAARCRQLDFAFFYERGGGVVNCYVILKGGVSGGRYESVTRGGRGSKNQEKSVT